MYKTAGSESVSPIFNIHDELKEKLSPEQIQLLETLGFPIIAFTSQEAFARFTQKVLSNETDIQEQTNFIMELGEIERNLFRKSITQIIDEMSDDIRAVFQKPQEICQNTFVSYHFDKLNGLLKDADSAHESLELVVKTLGILDGYSVPENYIKRIMTTILKNYTVFKDKALLIPNGITHTPAYSSFSIKLRWSDDLSQIILLNGDHGVRYKIECKPPSYNSYSITKVSP